MIIEQIAKGLFVIVLVVFVFFGVPFIVMRITGLPKSPDYFDGEPIGESHTIYYIAWVLILLLLGCAYAIGKSIK